MPALGAVPIALCPRCQHETLPRLAQPSWHREKHRASKAEREPEPDPRAETIRRRKSAKQSRAAALRKQTRIGGILAAAKFYIDLKGHAAAPPPSGDCDRCLDMQAHLGRS